MQLFKRVLIFIGSLALCPFAPLTLVSVSSCRSSEPTNVAATYNKATGVLELVTFDRNKDGKPDAWNYMNGTALVRTEIDENFDGVVDRWEYYGADGKMEKVGFSRARDGKVDAWAFAGPDGQTTKVEIATRGDGKVNRWEHYEHGALIRAEEDSAGAGRPDKWEIYKDGALAVVELDTEKRGKPNRRMVYGPRGVRVEQIK
jgi:hypothetical protein